MVPGYREVRQLGTGRTGRVFLSTYQQTGAYVAIKYLNATLRRDTEFMDRFRSDTHELVEIDDQNVVRLYEYVETPTRAAVVMELVDGVSLRTLLAEHGRTSPEAALAVLKSTLLALAAAHDKGVAHRDVKPENILVQADGLSKLGDFGVVVHAEEPGVPAGSPAYMAPELWTRHEAGPAADLYAAACVLFETVRGRPPYLTYKEGESEEQDVPALRDRHLVEPVPLEVAPDTLRDLLRRGLAKDPALRYASARQFAAELEQDAVAGYGPDWEQRGRRHLAELATLLALRFPLARTDRPEKAPRGLRLPKLPPQLWIAAATVVAVAIALVVAGGRIPPGALLMPPAQDESEPTRAAPTRPVPTKSVPTRPAPTPVPTRAAPTSAPTRTGANPAATAPPMPPTAVQSATIVRWSGAAGSIRVAASGAGAVRLRITYTRRDDDEGAARTVRRESRTLRGRTAYTSAVAHDPGDVACGGRAYVGILVMTEPAAANGPQVNEAVVDGPACPSPTPAPSPTHTPTQRPSTSAVGTPTPSGPESEEPVARSPEGALGAPADQPSIGSVDRLSDGSSGEPPPWPLPSPSPAP
ncbi:serine/threonine-protein kinase [Nonomuraea sp. NPDC046802]|uniref:serine/threonine-protein kinase n=1 Tax=Nonomuraea sp. NPDC046802 TaxID=3154919 RepID=UPI0033C0EB0E